MNAPDVADQAIIYQMSTWSKYITDGRTKFKAGTIITSRQKIRRMQTYQEIWKETHNKVKRTYGKFFKFSRNANT